MIFNSKLSILLVIFYTFSPAVIAQDYESKNKSKEEDFSDEAINLSTSVDTIFKDFLNSKKKSTSNKINLEKYGVEDTENTSLELLKSSPDRRLRIEFSERAYGAKLQVLDKIYGLSEEIQLSENSKKNYQALNLTLKRCYYSKNSAGTNSVASISISDQSQDINPVSSWMSSKQSHVTNYDNYRYSVWLLSCIISDQE